MENRINALLNEYYLDLPAFFLGSRMDGYSNENSDWDVGIIGTNKGMEIDNISFIPIDVSNLDKKAARFIFRRDVYPFAKKIKPLKKEETVRNIERKVKGHIVQYARQKLGRESISGEDVVKTYFGENMRIYPLFRKKGLRFLKSQHSVSVSSDIYDKFLKEFKPSQKYIYRDKKSDRVLYFFEVSFKDLKKPSLSNFIDYTKRFVKTSANFISEFINS
jgi:predicted nucleotidyltransferase